MRGSGAEPTAAGGHWGSGGKSPSLQRQGGLGAKWAIFAIFYKNNPFLHISAKIVVLKQ